MFPNLEDLNNVVVKSPFTYDLNHKISTSSGLKRFLARFNRKMNFIIIQSLSRIFPEMKKIFFRLSDDELALIKNKHMVCLINNDCCGSLIDVAYFNYLKIAYNAVLINVETDRFYNYPDQNKIESYKKVSIFNKMINWDYFFNHFNAKDGVPFKICIGSRPKDLQNKVKSTQKLLSDFPDDPLCKMIIKNNGKIDIGNIGTMSNDRLNIFMNLIESYKQSLYYYFEGSLSNSIPISGETFERLKCFKSQYIKDFPYEPSSLPRFEKNLLFASRTNVLFGACRDSKKPVFTISFCLALLV